MESYYGYPTEKIRGGNPYNKCSACGVSEPAINGRIVGHDKNCCWRGHKEGNPLSGYNCNCCDYSDCEFYGIDI